MAERNEKASRFLLGEIAADRSENQKTFRCATGILIAIPTGGTHVTIIPTNGSVNQWMRQGQSSIWSQTLSLIVVEWGGY